MGNRSKRQATRKRKRQTKQKRKPLLQVRATAGQSTPSQGAATGDSDQRTEVSISELETIIARSEKGPLDEQDRYLLLSAAQTLRYLTAELEKKGISVARLKKLLFGATTETSKNLGVQKEDQNEADSQENTDAKDEPPDSDQPKKKRKGHGRNGAAAYTGAKKVQVPHETLKPGDPCPECHDGTLYKTSKPGTLVCVTGRPPLDATVFELEKLRCGLCGEIFTAKAPAEAKEEKYDAEAASMVALLKYGTGMPFNRLEGLQESLGIPLPAGTQWEILEAIKPLCSPAYEFLTIEAAQGEVVYNDDTGMLIRESSPPEQDETSDSNTSERKGQFTSGIVSILEDHKIALYFTGNKHAGENLDDLLRNRAEKLAEPIQMCDGLSCNIPKNFKTVVGNCLVHGRRQFTDIIAYFPTECEHVIKQIGKVFKIDDITRKELMSDLERLHYHQEHSGPIMEQLKKWLQAKLEHKEVEPNSALGGAIQYMLTHWEKLTLFLRHPGAPLDNNICERALKKAILHRKNSYFYLNANGAAMGDQFMSLIHTCELNGINPFKYLTALQKHASAVAISPGDWLPWNYQESLQEQPSTSEA